MWLAWLSVAIAAAAVLAIIVASFVGEWLRSRAMRRMAQRLGLAYSGGAGNLAEWLGLLRAAAHLPGGARHLLWGTWQGREVYIFDCSTQGRSFTLQPEPWVQELTCFLLKHEWQFPELRVQPRRTAWDVELRVWRDTVELESAEFAKAFRVCSKDRRFAYDMCHPQMMEYLLRHRDLAIWVAHGCLALWVQPPKPVLLDVADIPERLHQMVEIRNLFPEYLFPKRPSTATEGDDWMDG